MKIGALINARLGSKRLPKKHLRDIHGKLAIEQLLDRLMPYVGVEFIIATGDERENKPLEAIAKARNIAIVFGDQTNIPNRHLQAARQHNLDAIVSIDADDVLTSPRALESTIGALREGKSLVRTEGLPLGMNILWAYTVETLIKAIQSAGNDGSFDTGWGWIFKDEIHYIRCNIPDAEKIRATLDYPEDLKFFRRIFDECPPSILPDEIALCKWIIANKIHKINKKYCNA